MKVDRLTIVLPWPDKGLFPNAKNGKHWGSFQKLKEKARTDGATAARESLGSLQISFMGEVKVSLTFCAPDARSRDADGLLGSCKHQLDGISLVIGIDDKAFNPITVIRAKDKEKKGFVLVELLTGG